MDKQLFYQNDAKKRNFPWNIDIYGYMDKNIFFSVWSQNSIICLEILIFTVIWTKNDFLKIISKTCFTPKCWYLWKYEQKNIFSTKVVFVDILIFSKIYTKNGFSKWSQNNWVFLEFLILTDLWTKSYFIKMMSKNVIFLEILIFTVIWTKMIFVQYDLKRALFASKYWYLRLYGQKTIFSK